MSTSYWNSVFTSMIRKSNATLWGNWTLNPFVLPGAVGYIESNSGAFVRVDNMPNITIKNFASPENWSIDSSSVHRTQSGVNSLIGAGNVDAGVKGSYKETNEAKAFESHLWPSEADAIAHEDVGIAFQFASFDNKLIMPNWIMPLMGFAVHFDNAHSGTYRAHCKIEWSEPSATEASRQYIGCDTLSGHLFMLFNRRRTIVKALHWDPNCQHAVRQRPQSLLKRGENTNQRMSHATRPDRCERPRSRRAHPAGAGLRLRRPVPRPPRLPRVPSHASCRPDGWSHLWDRRRLGRCVCLLRP